MKPLLDAGADVNARDDQGNTPLHWVARTSELWYAPQVAEVIRLLLDAGADINATDDHGDTPLHQTSRASTSAYPEFIALLLDAGAVITETNNDGETACDLTRDRAKDVLELLCP